MKHFFAAIVVLCLTACATATGVDEPFVVPEQLSIESGSRIGILSVAANELDQDRIGFMVFGNKSEIFDISDWNLDEEWKAQIESVLPSIAQFEIVDLSVDPANVVALYPSRDKFFYGGKRFNYKDTVSEFSRIARQNDLDALIVAASAVYDPQRAGMIYEGPSIVTNYGPRGFQTIYLLTLELALIDGTSGELINAEIARVGSRWTEPYDAVPYQEAGDDLDDVWFSDYAAEDKAMLRQAFASMPDDAWLRSLSKVLEDKKASRNAD